MKRYTQICISTMLACLTMIGAPASLKADANDPSQKRPDYQQHMLWAANNWDAGGSVDCPTLYIAAQMGAAIVYGGRGVVMQAAQRLLSSNLPYSREGAFGLVLLTQCHNPQARNTLLVAGPDAVLNFLSIIRWE